MSECSPSVYMPAVMPRVREMKSYDILAQEKGWTPEMLRECRELPKKILPDGARIVRMNPDVFKDVFKDMPVQNVEHEYNSLEERFYEKLSKIQILFPKVKKEREKLKKGSKNKKQNSHKSSKSHSKSSSTSSAASNSRKDKSKKGSDSSSHKRKKSSTKHGKKNKARQSKKDQ